MGPKGYRICWLGTCRQRMEAVLHESAMEHDDCTFLELPGADPDSIKELHPCFFVLDLHQVFFHRRDISRWISACRETSAQARVLILTSTDTARHTHDGLLGGADWVFLWTLSITSAPASAL